MLVCAGQLVEESGLSAVLVANQCESQHRAVRKRIAGSFGMKFTGFSETRVRNHFLFF